MEQDGHGHVMGNDGFREVRAGGDVAGGDVVR